MGKINKGILGGFSGKVGTVIGGNWKGIDYIRSRSKVSKKAPTTLQHSQQLKFGIAARFLQSMVGLLAISFKDFAVKKTGINSALSYTLKHAIIGSYPHFSISYPHALISRGDLPNALAPIATMGSNGLLSFSWTDNSGMGLAKTDDKALLVAYCPEMNRAIYSTGSAARSALTDTLNLAEFSGKQVETYIGFISLNGLNVAGSIYTGQFPVS